MHLRHYIQEWNIRARVELPAFPLPDGPRPREVTLSCEDKHMQITFASPEAMPTVEAILTHLLFEAELLVDRPTFPEWSQGLFDSPESSRTNDDEWILYRRSQEQTDELKRLLGASLFERCLAAYRRDRTAAEEEPPGQAEQRVAALTFRTRPLLLAPGGVTPTGSAVLQALGAARGEPHEDYRLNEEYILGGDHLDQLPETALVAWLPQLAMPLREWQGRNLRLIVAILPESVELSLKILFYIFGYTKSCPYCVTLDAQGQFKRLFDPSPLLRQGLEARQSETF